MRQSSVIIFLLIVRCKLIKNQDINNLSQTYANVSLAIANYFSSACVYFLLHSKDQDNLNLYNTAKYISAYKKFTTAKTIPQYFHMLNTTFDLDLCYMPLHVIIDNGDNNLMREVISMHSHLIPGPEQHNGGVWLIFLKSIDQSFINDYFHNIDTPYDVELIVASVNSDQINLKEIYRVAPNFPLRQLNFGYWSIKAGLIAPKKVMPHTRRSDLEGLKLFVGFADVPPMTIRKKDGKKIIRKGYMGDIWKVIETTINASSVYVDNDELGSKYKNMWTGLLGELIHNKVDLAISPFILTRDRFDEIDFSYPLLETNFQVFFQHPGSNADDEGFLLPFETKVWFTIGVWLIIGSSFFYISCRTSKTSLVNEDKKFTLSKSIFVLFAALCGQASDETPKKIPSRIIFLFTFIIATVLIPSYSASLISYLTIMKPEIPFTDLKEFYENEEYKMLVRNGSYEYDLFEYGSHVDPYVRKIFRRDLKGITKLPKNNRQGITMLCENKFNAFFGIEASVEWNLIKNEETLEKLNCIITKMIKDAGKISIGMGFPVNSRYRSLINHKITTLKSLGIVDRIREIYWIDYEKNSEEWKPVDAENIKMIYAVLGVGILAASVIFAIEFILRAKFKSLPNTPYTESVLSFSNPSSFASRSHEFRTLRKNLRSERMQERRASDGRIIRRGISRFYTQAFFLDCDTTQNVPLRRYSRIHLFRKLSKA